METLERLAVACVCFKAVIKGGCGDSGTGAGTRQLSGDSRRVSKGSRVASGLDSLYVEPETATEHPLANVDEGAGIGAGAGDDAGATAAAGAGGGAAAPQADGSMNVVVVE